MKILWRAPLLILLLSTWLVPPSSVLADERKLEKILLDATFAKKRPGAKIPQPESGSNHELALSRDGPKALAEWLGSPSEVFKEVGKLTSSGKGFSKSRREYKGNGIDSVFSFTVLVPAPKNAEAARFSLLPDFAAYDPKIVRSENEEQIQLEGFEATAFTNSGSQMCYIVLKLPHDSVLGFEATNCSSGEALFAFASGFNLKRLRDKLST